MKPRLLIANQDRHWCERCERLFRQAGYDVDLAHHALECLDKLRQLSYAGLVLELELPWGGGDGVLAYLREESIQRIPPVFVVSKDVSSPRYLAALLESLSLLTATGRGPLADGGNLALPPVPWLVLREMDS